ncbi:MAG: Ig-like domain-containing protein [Bifidobacteriaceae bacterium]|jgi:hypothetical protein|nr:Ig-like domain-containing protein [Bifidobacteriaceae bacterium]
MDMSWIRWRVPCAATAAIALMVGPGATTSRSASAGPQAIVTLLATFADLPTGGKAPILGPARMAGHTGALRASNDIVAVEINGSATAAEVSRALADATEEPARAMTEALGPALGPLLLAAMDDGDVPVTMGLLKGQIAQGIGNYQPAKASFAYPRPFVRLGFTANGGRIDKTPSPEYAALASNGSFPSGHTIDGYVAATALATFLPEFAPHILARGSQFAHHRIQLGVHYPLDVIGGRMAAQQMVQTRWSDQTFRQRLTKAATEVRSALASRCLASGRPADLVACADDGGPHLSPDAALATYTQRLTYGLGHLTPATESCDAGSTGVAMVPPGADDLLITSHPELTPAQRREVLAATAVEAGIPLDTRTGQTSWARINLAAAMAATVQVDSAGHAVISPGMGHARGAVTTVPVDPGDPIAAVTASQRSVTLITGSSYTIPAGAYGSDGARSRPAFTSKAARVASVSRTGTVTALAPGKATIVLCAGSQRATVTITVRARRPARTSPTAVTVRGIPARMAVGDAVSARATYKPARAIGVKVRYTSSRPSVLAVDSAGHVRALRPGTATVKVKAGARVTTVTVRVE